MLLFGLLHDSIKTYIHTIKSVHEELERIEQLERKLLFL